MGGFLVWSAIASLGVLVYAAWCAKSLLSVPRDDDEDERVGPVLDSVLSAWVLVFLLALCFLVARFAQPAWGLGVKAAFALVAGAFAASFAAIAGALVPARLDKATLPAAMGIGAGIMAATVLGLAFSCRLCASIPSAVYCYALGAALVAVFVRHGQPLGADLAASLAAVMAACLALVNFTNTPFYTLPEYMRAFPFIVVSFGMAAWASSGILLHFFGSGDPRKDLRATCLACAVTVLIGVQFACRDAEPFVMMNRTWQWYAPLLSCVIGVLLATAAAPESSFAALGGLFAVGFIWGPYGAAAFGTTLVSVGAITALSARLTPGTKGTGKPAVRLALISAFILLFTAHLSPPWPHCVALENMTGPLLGFLIFLAVLADEFPARPLAILACFAPAVVGLLSGRETMERALDVVLLLSVMTASGWNADQRTAERTPLIWSGIRLLTAAALAFTLMFRS